MYANDLAGLRTGIPPMSMLGLGGPSFGNYARNQALKNWLRRPFGNISGIPAQNARAALIKKSVWTRADWTNFHNMPPQWTQPAGTPFDYTKSEPFGGSSRPKGMNSMVWYKAKAWENFKPTLKKEYNAAVAAKKKADDAAKLKTEQTAKQKELEIKIKTAGRGAQTSLTEAMKNLQIERQVSQPGKILGMDKKTAMIVGGAAAGGLLLLAISN